MRWRERTCRCIATHNRDVLSIGRTRGFAYRVEVEAPRAGWRKLLSSKYMLPGVVTGIAVWIGATWYYESQVGPATPPGEPVDEEQTDYYKYKALKSGRKTNEEIMREKRRKEMEREDRKSKLGIQEPLRPTDTIDQLIESKEKKEP